MLALIKFVEYNSGWLILPISRIVEESYRWNHQIHTRNIRITYHPPD